MDILEAVRDMLNEATAFEATKNFYFTKHQCGGKDITVRLEYCILREQDEKTVHFGLCPECKTMFYHEDHEVKSFKPR